MKKRLFSLLLAAVMIFGLLPVGALAETSGKCGNDLTWSLNDSVLTISGTGEMNSYSGIFKAPWHSERLQIKSVVLESGVTSIGNNAFIDCSVLTDISIPEGVTSIGSKAFDSCVSLTGAVIPEGVTSIGDKAFENCVNILSVSIPGSVGSIGNKIFGNCASLADIAISEGVTSIEENAFSTCYNLKSVAIPKSMTSIGANAFSGCMKLESVYISDVAAWCSLSFGGLSSNPLYYADKLYLNGEQLTELVIPEGVTSICKDAFNNCGTLTSVTIPKSVTSIGADAFSGCEGIENVYISDIAAWCAISFGNSGSNPLRYADNLYLNNKKVTSLIIPDGVTEIADYAFYGGGFESVTFPKEIVSVGTDAFNECDELKYVFISDLAAWCGISFKNGTANPLYYADDMYQGIRKLKNLVIPDSVTVIQSYAFYGGGFESITIHENVTDIGANAFGACTGLKEISYNAAEAACSPEAFGNAGSDDSGVDVSFGANVKKLPANMFNSLSRPNIRNVIFAGNAPTVGDNAFAWTVATAYYPYGNETWTDKVRQLNYGNGVFVWKAYSDAKVKSKECTIRKSVYVSGEELDTSGIVFRIERDDGCVEAYDYSSGYITLGKYNTTAAGWHSVSATCKDVKTNLKYYVHSTKTVIPDRAEYPESSHDYENSLNKTYSYSIKNAISFKVSFSEATAVAENDSIHVNGTKYTGTELAGKTLELTGDTLKIRLDSDKSGTAYGFSIDKIEAVCIDHSYTASVTAPTCTEKGYTTHTCSCGDSYKDNTVPALGHDYVNGKCSRCGAVEALRIKTQPKSITTGVGTVKFSVTASGYGLTYQWQYSADSGKTWTDSGATSAMTANYSVSAREEISGYKYRCQIKDADGKSVTSSTATLTVVPEITKQPTDLEAVSGTTGKFSITVNGNELTYQWQYSTDGGKTWTNSGATSANTATFSVSAREEIDGYKYRCKVSNSCGKSVTSNVVTLTVVWGISKQPSDLKAVSGTIAKFSVAAEGEGLTYQWQYLRPNSEAWTNADTTSAKTATLAVNAREVINGYKYHCVVCDASGKSVTSSAATLTIVPEITKQPMDISVVSGTTGKFSIAVNGDELTYQWQYSTDGGKTWADGAAASANAATFSVSAHETMDGCKYRCRVTNSCGNSVTSDAATLTVVWGITKQPSDLRAKSGTTGIISITAAGNGLSYQWQYQKTGSSEWTDSTAKSAKTETFSVNVRSEINGYKYRCRVTNSNGNTVTSNVVTLTVTAAITKQPTDLKAASGTTGKISVTADGVGLSYQWQYQKKGSSSWINSTAKSAKTATLSVSAREAINGYKYRCVVNDANGGSVTSSTVTLSVTAQISKQPTDLKAKSGTTGKISITASGEGLSYQWQYQKKGSSTWTNSTAKSAKTATFSVSVRSAINGYKYRCQVTNSCGNTVTSKVVTLTVTPAITKQPANLKAKNGTTGKISITADGVGLTYRWQYLKPGSKTWTNSGATSGKTATLSVSVRTAINGYKYRCIVKDSAGNSITSSTATLTVK